MSTNLYQQQEWTDCEQYLKDGETPAQRICRERRDTDLAMSLLAREKQKCAELWRLVQDAAPIVAEYANRNPKHLFRDAAQDPCGAHAWIERMRSATCVQDCG